MTTQTERAALFKSLHVKGRPLILFNAWDAGSARALQEIGAKAVATGSWSAAAAQGYSDGEALPFALALANLERIIASVDLLVTIDLESGYGHSPAQVQDSAAQVIQAGAVGINLEDQIIGEDQLHSIEDQCARIRAVRAAADQAGVPLFINARTDVFLQLYPGQPGDDHLQEALRRAAAYAEAGGSGFFAPGLGNPQYIETLCRHSPLPVNILMLPGTPAPKALAGLGVARISYGAGPYRLAMNAFKEAGRKALAMSDTL